MTPYGLILFFLSIVPYIECGKRLNEYISHYETLSYDETHIHATHSRAKRSVTKDPHVFLKFETHGRNFHIRLKRDVSTLSDSLVVDSPNGTISVDTSHIYRGDVLGEKDSLVFGSIIDGVFEGKIITDRDSYYVENAKHYFPNRTHLDYGFHSIIYNENDVVDPYENRREGHVGGCGINEEISKWMDNIQKASVDEETHQQPKSKQRNVSLFHTKPGNLESKWRDDNNWHTQSHERVRRQNQENKNTCSLYIRTDPLIWRYIREGIAQHDRGSQSAIIDEKTREEILSLIARQVTAVNYIYSNAKFDGRVEHRNIKFQVQRINIDDDITCSESYNGENPFCMENIDLPDLLKLHSHSNYELFCLAYVFTYRDFIGGALGLTWEASASGVSGGICEKYKTYAETVNGLNQNTKLSLNTGIITFSQYNRRVPPKVSQLSLAHEIGHNFGSPHDYPQECRPGGINGNYIMFGGASGCDRPNNSKFSTCSLRNISNVLDNIVEGRKRNCLLLSDSAFCGNKIVEEGEECDCGFDDDECQEKCCYPRQINENDIIMNSSARGCTRRARAQCSPSEGPCCHSETCTFVSAESRTKCKETTECSWSSICNGETAKCSEPIIQKDRETTCNNGTQICIAGECIGSICDAWNMTDCFLTSQIIPNITERKLCELACRGIDTGRSSICKGTSEFGLHVGLPEAGISLPPGSPCNNYQGYCNEFSECRPVDSEDILMKLRHLQLNSNAED